MSKQCKQCGIEFAPLHEKRGHEQLYCSKKCGQISARLRREERLKNAVNEKQIIQQQPTTNQSFNMAQQPMAGIVTNGGSNTLNDISYLEKLYEAKNENNYLKLKCENFEEKIKALQFEINELNNEIDAMETSEELGEQQGFLGGVVAQFKSDPINTINFAKSLMSEMFNSKKEKTNA